MYINKDRESVCWACKSKLGKGSEGQTRAWETCTKGPFGKGGYFVALYVSFNYQEVRYFATQKFKGGKSGVGRGGSGEHIAFMGVEGGNLQYEEYIKLETWKRKAPVNGKKQDKTKSKKTLTIGWDLIQEAVKIIGEL